MYRTLSWISETGWINGGEWAVTFDVKKYGKYTFSESISCMSACNFAILRTQVTCRESCWRSSSSSAGDLYQLHWELSALSDLAYPMSHLKLGLGVGVGQTASIAIAERL